MAKTIKTREAVRDVKTRAPNPHIGTQMKRAALKTKDAVARQVQEPQGSSPNEYAGNAVEGKAKGAAHEAVSAADSRGRKAVKRLQDLPRREVKQAPAPETPTADVPEAAAGGANGSGASTSQAPTESAAPDRAKAQNSKAQQQKKKAAQRRGKGSADKAASSATKSESGNSNQPKRKSKKAAKPKQKPGRTVGRSKNAAKTAQQSARQTRQAAKAAAKSAKTAKQTAQRTKQAAEQAVKRGKDAVKAVYKMIKAAVESAKLLVEAIIAGGWVAVVIILVICLAGFLIASPFGIFFSGGGEQSLPQVVRELSEEYSDRLGAVQRSNEHDALSFEGGAMSIDWPQVLAVYAVKVVTDPLDPEEVTTFDKKKTDKLRKILNEMNSFTHSVQSTQTDEGTERTLTIRITAKSAADMAQAYHFNAEQREQLEELLSPEYADLWALLLGGYVPGSGEILGSDTAWTGTGMFAWPMQPDVYHISSGYGYRDDPKNPGTTKFHKGVDLAANGGTPILAAADGIVEVANSTDSWGYGWGYYVRIKHQGGYETLYAHCSRIAVARDEEVYAGQVIGYVGSTGNSTGPHLHFEVRKDGTVSNPMNYFTPK